MAALVSIITPCYNGEKYLDRYFKSILAQTYPNVEIIFVNDGSTDNTERIALEYGEKLKSRGYDFTYIYQSNAGQSEAINQGLKLFKGTYLNWTDSDDYITPDSIEKRVSALEQNPEAGLVAGQTEIVDDINYRRIGLITEVGSYYTDSKVLISEILTDNSAFICCCSTLVRSSMFREAMPNPLQIETTREIGQNYQLFIPILFERPAVFIQEILAHYVVHSDSHSHQKKTFEQMMHICDVSTQTLNSIATRLRIDDQELISWFKKGIVEYDLKNRLEIMQRYQRNDGLTKIVTELKRIGCFDASARKKVLKIRFPWIKALADFIWKIRK